MAKASAFTSEKEHVQKAPMWSIEVHHEHNCGSCKPSKCCRTRNAWHSLCCLMQKKGQHPFYQQWQFGWLQTTEQPHSWRWRKQHCNQLNNFFKWAKNKNLFCRFHLSPWWWDSQKKTDWCKNIKENKRKHHSVGHFKSVKMLLWMGWLQSADCHAKAEKNRQPSGADEFDDLATTTIFLEFLQNHLCAASPQWTHWGRNHCWLCGGVWC